MAYSDIALLLALTLTVVLAYPAKDDEAYYNKLRDYQEPYGKDVRNLDGIDARDEARPLFNFLSKTGQAADSERGPNLKFDFGSSSHLDGIGGGHLVRELELEQGLAPSILDVSLPEYASPLSFGVVRKYPVTLRLVNPLESEEALKELLYNPGSSKFGLQCLKNERCGVSSDYDNLMKVFSEHDLPDFNYERVQGPLQPRHMDALGGGHLLNTKRSLDSIGGRHLNNYKKELESFGGSDLLNYEKDLDSIGGGHLLYYKKDLDSIGGGHLLNYKKDLDSIGGGHLLNYKKDLDSLGGGHLLNYKKDLDSIGGGHLLNYKKDLDSLGGGHLMNYKKDLDSIGGGHLLNYKKSFDPIGDDNVLNTKGYLDSFVGRHLLNSNKDIDALVGDSVLRRRFALSPYTKYQQYYSGTGLPLQSSRPLCTGSRWFKNILNNYLAKEESKGNYQKVSKGKTVNVLDNDSKDKLVQFKEHTPRWIKVETKPDVIDVWMKGLSGGLYRTTSEGDQTEAPFSGIIEMNKVYISFPRPNNR